MIDSVQSCPCAERLSLVEQVHGCTVPDPYRGLEDAEAAATRRWLRGTGRLPLIGVNALIGSGVTLALPAILGHSVDSIVAGSGYTRWLVVAASLIGLGIAASIVDAFAGAACVAETTAWLRHRLVRHVVRGGPGGSRDLETGDLVTRVSANALDAAQAGPAAATAVAAIAPPVGSLVLLAVIDPWLAAAFFGGVLLVILVLWTFAKRTADVSLAYQKTQGRIAALLSESLAGLRTITAAGTTEDEERRALGLLPDLHRHGVVTWRILARSGAQAAVVGPLVLVAVLVVGGLQLVAGNVTAGELFAASQYAVLGAGLGNLTDVLGELARAKAGVQRSAEVVAIKPVAHGTLPLPSGPGQLRFDSVSVIADGNVLLDNVNLDLPGGVTVAVVGPSGAGKSVLTAVAARLRDPSTGQVSLDGVPLQAVSRRALRSAVGCAFERPQLVARTVGEGLVPDAVSPIRTPAAARATHVHDFISRLPDGYLTSLRKAPMSGGERQRPHRHPSPSHRGPRRPGHLARPRPGPRDRPTRRPLAQHVVPRSLRMERELSYGATALQKRLPAVKTSCWRAVSVLRSTSELTGWHA